MGLARSAGRAVVMTTVLSGVLAGTVPSLAGVGGTTRVSGHAVGSGSWAAVATTASTAPFGTGALALNLGLLGKQLIYFNVANAGTLSLTGTTYTLSGTNLPGGSNVTVYACVGGTWVQS